MFNKENVNETIASIAMQEVSKLKLQNKKFEDELTEMKTIETRIVRNHGF